MRGAITGLLLIAVTGCTAKAGVLSRHLLRLHSGHSFTITMHETGAPRFQQEAAPLLSRAEPHYQPQPSGLDRIDPSAMRVWGGEIGGEGVKGGAVVSLTWPTP